VTARAALAPWLAAALGCVAIVAVFWPGYTSVDSLHQYQQALAGRYDNVHPPLFAFVWGLAARLVEGSGGMHVLLVATFSAGLARAVWAAVPGPRARVAAFVVIALWPPVLLVVAHVWKDVAMSAAILLGAAASFRWRADGRPRDRVAALLWLAAAVAMRHNAWPAVLPFVAFVAMPPRDAMQSASLVRGVAFAVGVALALAAVPRLVEHALGAERRALWPTVALWDLGAVSLATGEVRIPREVAPTLTLDDIARHYQPWSCVSLYDSGKIRLAMHVPYSAAETRAVDAAWRRALVDAPGAYAAHRARIVAGLVLAAPAAAPRELVYVPEHRVTAPERAASWPERAVLAFAAATWSTPVFALGPYLLAALVAVATSKRAARDVPLALLASALLYAAPLAVVATSAEYRYVHWSVVACLLATAAALGSRSASMREPARSKRAE